MEPQKKEMSIKEFNEINTQIADLLTKINGYDHLDLTNARRLLKEAGKRVSDYFYRIFESNETEEKNQENIKSS